MKKNDFVNLEIFDITLAGAGVGKHEGLTVFVDAAVTGDTVKAHILKVKSNYAFAKIDEIIKPSEWRVDSHCGSYPKCGGCSFRHISYGQELKIKENAVKNNLKHIGEIEPELEAITGLEPDGYRNKAQYPVSFENNELKIGFFAGRSHRVIDCPDCSLQPVEFSAAVSAFRSYVLENNVSVFNESEHKGLIRHIYFRKAVSTGEIMICIVVNGNSIPEKQSLIDAFKNVFGDNLKSVILNENRDKTNVIMGKKCTTLYGSDHITDVLCGVKVRISPLSFYQVNHNVAEKLYEKADEYADPQGKTVLDLYCGAGTIGLSMAEKARKIIGVEIIPEAVEDAKFNAAQNGFKNAEFFCSDAAEAAEKLKNSKVKPDVVIVDPPRKGCDETLIKTITEDFAPERVVYVSCDSATMARDCKIFKAHGYETVKAAPFDMFPRTGHVETVCLLCRSDKSDMNIRKVTMADFERVNEVYGVARKFMALNGNPHQWGDLGYPTPEMIAQDIENGELFAVTENGYVEGVFFWKNGDDPTYSEIDGSWLNEEPYGVIHRVASSGRVKGVLKAAVDYCLQFTDNIRIDTHVDNTVMQSALEKLGFKYCGMVYLPHGVWMKAYQLSK